jgi:long-subunit fatty acid transport protein
MDRTKIKYFWPFMLLSFFLYIQNVIAQTPSKSEIIVGNDFGIGARAMGMGGAFIGVADDYTALHWNPAGLSQIKWMEAFGGLSHEKVNSDTVYFGSNDSTFSSNTRPNSFGIVLSVPVYRGGLAFAFGANRLQSFDSRLRFNGFNDQSVDENFEFGQLYINTLSDEAGGIYSYSFGTAVDIAPGLSVGGSLGFLSGGYSYTLRINADDNDNLDTVLDSSSYIDTLDSDYFGVDAKIGLLFRVAEQLRFGATLDMPLELRVNEYWTSDVLHSYDDGNSESGFDEGNFDYDISRPLRFGAGVAVLPLPGLIFAFDLAYTDWTQTEYSEAPAEDIPDDYFRTNYRGTFQLHTGAEYTIPNIGLKIRGGYIYDPTPFIPDILSIDSNRQFLTLGIGMIMDEIISLDLAYIMGTWGDSTTDGIIKKDQTANRIFLSAGYRF